MTLQQLNENGAGFRHLSVNPDFLGQLISFLILLTVTFLFRKNKKIRIKKGTKRVVPIVPALRNTHDSDGLAVVSEIIFLLSRPVLPENRLAVYDEPRTAHIVRVKPQNFWLFAPEFVVLSSDFTNHP